MWSLNLKIKFVCLSTMFFLVKYFFKQLDLFHQIELSTKRIGPRSKWQERTMRVDRVCEELRQNGHLRHSYIEPQNFVTLKK